MSKLKPYHPSQYSSLVIQSIIIVNTVMFFTSLIFSGSKITLSLNPLLAFSPDANVLKFLGAAGTSQVGGLSSIWPLITANWLHGSILHLLINMMAFRTVAPVVVKEFGVCRMFSLFTLTGVSGYLLSWVGHVSLTIGASCSLCGLIGAALYFGRSRGGSWGKLVYKQTRGWAFSLLIIGFLLPGINNWGHAGGLISGIIFGWILGYREKRKESYFDLVLALFFAVTTLFILGKSVVYGAVLIFG